MADRRPVISSDVMKWSEFRNLAERLGIDLTLRNQTISITLSMHGPVEISQKFHATDNKAGANG